MASCNGGTTQPCPEHQGYDCPEMLMAGWAVPANEWTRKWSNNPVWIARYMMRNFEYTVVGNNWFNDVKNQHTADYCFTVVEDDTDAEAPVVGANDYQAYLDEKWRRLRSTNRYTGSSIFNPLLELLADSREFHEPDIWWAGANSSPTVGQSRTYLSYRFTANGVINDEAELSNILFSLLLPTFRGFIRFNQFGKIEFDCRKPVRQAFQRADTLVGTFEIPVSNVTTLYKGGNVHGNISPIAVSATTAHSELSDKDYVLIGVGKKHAEVAKILGVRYVNGNAETAVAASSTGSLGVSAPTEFYELVNAPAELRIDFSGTATAGEKIELKFTEPDGTILVWDYVVGVEDVTLDIVVQMFKARLMASPSFREGWTADVFVGFPNRITVRSQTGYIIVDRAMLNAHFIGDELIRVCEVYEDGRDEEHKDGVKDNMRNFRFNIRKHETYHGVKSVFISAVQDHREVEIQPRVAWDAAEEERNLNLLELDLRFVDNYRQAAWLTKSAAVEFVDGNLWASWGTGIRGMFHEEGDVVAVRHQTMQGVSWTPFSLEAISYDESTQETKLDAKIYFSAAYDDRIAKEEKFLESSLTRNEDTGNSPPPLLAAGGYSTVRTGDGGGDQAQNTQYEPEGYETFPTLQRYSPSGQDKL